MHESIATPLPDLIENHVFADIRIGDGAHLLRTLRAEDIQLFAAMSGDVNPAHVDPEYAASSQFHGIIAHGMWGAALISTVIGTEFPGPGSIYLGQTLRFERPVHVGDTLDVRIAVTARDQKNHQLTLDCRCTNQHGIDVITGSALVLAPTERISRARVQPMEVSLTRRGLSYRRLLARSAQQPAIAVAVVHPCSADALRDAMEAAALGLIEPVLVGPAARIRALAQDGAIDLGEHRIVDAAHSHAAAARAVAMARAGEVQALMQGSLDAAELLAAIADPALGLGTDRHLSHAFVLDVPAYSKPLLMADGMVNPRPGIDIKRDILRNAIDLAHAIGIVTPKVAVLAGSGAVNAAMRSTLDAAALCKMAERGQIAGALVDGPLSFEQAIAGSATPADGSAARVAGAADVLIAPDLESARLLTGQLRCLADAQVAGLVLGASVPVILTLADATGVGAIASCALAQLMVRAGGDPALAVQLPLPLPAARAAVAA
ncbi:bifunctional enoyl-CoA hydratase/phosphate acetyltransferase [Derxia lacustris]|uniref:bifunctional enoyl-CoA hydratase/phosphate acetyltransferase n=1 Tax=Derxia lacustris TaxID=764842 RepID=UPI001592C8C9|nr:bifunctional enoyl-CoA hydratase/phosphate acetyltransferase [Derxia lacustris]